MATGFDPSEDDRLRSVVTRNAQSIRAARQRAEYDLLAAKEALEGRTLELERANALIRAIAENAASCLLLLDSHGVANYVNPATVEETGRQRADWKETPFHELLHAPESVSGHAAASCPIAQALASGLSLKKHRDVFVRDDGSTFPVSCSLSPLRGEGRAAGAVLEFRDISDELVAQRALEEANRRKDEFLATLSHELRTPMTAVLGWARMLRIGLPDSEVQNALIAIERSAEIQAQMIDDVLDVSRIVAGKLTFVPTAVAIAPVVRAAMTTVHPAATAKGIELLASIPPDLPDVLGDEGRLQQVIWNLLANSVKFTPRGGSVTIRAVEAGSLLRLTVADTGKGIESGYLSRVFEPFSQEDGSFTRAHEGIGLGLSIVRSLVELHGGRVRVASEGAGKGATFTVELPILETAGTTVPEVSPTVPPRTSGSEELASLAGLRILIIDDQLFTRDLVRAIFRRAGAEVQAEASVREGLDRFREMKPDVVVCDLAMPVEDGFAFIAAVRGEGSTTPVIALTAFGRQEDRTHALDSGFDVYMKKPVDPIELSTTVLRLARELD